MTIPQLYEMVLFIAMSGRVQLIHLKSCSDKKSSGNSVILKLMCYIGGVGEPDGAIVHGHVRLDKCYPYRECPLVTFNDIHLDMYNGYRTCTLHC